MVWSDLFIERMTLIHVHAWNVTGEIHAYLRKMKTKTVAAMATSEIDTPMYPVICKDKIFSCESLRGRALSKMAKWVRWLHLQTVMVELKFVSQPSSDHCPEKRIAPARSLGADLINHVLFNNYWISQYTNISVLLNCQNTHFTDPLFSKST